MGFFMMRHRHPSHLRHSGDLAPFSNAASVRHIDVQDIDGGSPHQRFTTIFGDLALASCHWYPAAFSHATHAAEVVIPMAWLLQPANVIGLNETTELNGLLWGPRLIGIAGDHELLPDGMAHLA